MIIRITFDLPGIRQILPLNYQYPLGSWIYKVINRGDREYANRLHTEGFQLESGKVFKLFAFSKLIFPARTTTLIPKTDRLEVRSREARLDIGFYIPESMEKFVMGLFEKLDLALGDRINTIAMKVKYVEVIKPEIPKQRPLRIQAITPIVMGFRRDDRKQEVYEKPDVPDYGEKFLQNLVNKYEAATSNRLNAESMSFKLLTAEPKSKKITIKDHTSEKTEIIGYLYTFELDAPQEIIELGLTAGFGRENSWGMGWGELV